MDVVEKMECGKKAGLKTQMDGVNLFYMSLHSYILMRG